ncbi:ABC transporter permease [Amycolatopsis jiangsuensis]|uniref:Iron(III) transport system permease protein n=1 Tax=Amycolatopsis jiangsuensis TaxID=1181879 RepID=A0A840IRC3_9PSEU|nr:iron ABC transporter permease [Amycolatopsis jiangsuensis]MBB4683995.1 iron(III) transport system permease protein [Amycolatopsis jiangsuensis]
MQSGTRVAPAAPPRPPDDSVRPPRRDRVLTAVNIAIGVLLAYLVLFPLGMLVYSSLKDSELKLPFQIPGFTLGNFGKVFSSPRVLEVAVNSLIFVVGTVALALIVSVSLAYLFERTDLPGRRFLAPSTLAPMAVPATVMAVAWVLAANPANGPLAILARRVFGLPVDIYSLPGMILVAGIFGVPSMYLMVAPAFARLNLEFEEAAATSGAGWLTRTRKVVLPLTVPAMSAAAMLLAVVALEEFAIPSILGTPDQIFVFSSLVQAALQPPSGLADYGRASAYGVLLVLLSLVMIAVYRRQTRESHRFRVVSGKGYRATPVRLGRWRIPAAVLVTLYVLVAIVIPILTLAWTSLTPFLQPVSLGNLGDLGFGNYAAIFDDPSLTHAIVNTLVISLVTATLTAGFGLWLALASARGGRAGRTLFDLSFLVFAVPSVVLGVAVLFLYLFLPIPVYGTIWIIVIALTTRYIPRASRMTQTALLQLDGGLEEVGRVSGARRAVVLRRIVLPLIAPSVTRTWLWVFANALGELPIALLLSSSDNRTVVVLLWDMIGESANYPEASALAVLLLAVSAGAVWWVNRRGYQQHI